MVSFKVIFLLKFRTIKRVKKIKKAIPQIPFYEINDRIRLNEFVVIDENGENLGKLNKFKALEIAKERELDLVLVSPNAPEPVAKIVDWSKFKYEKSKKARKNKAKPVENKEWWFSPKIQDNEIDIKLNNVKRFLEKGGNAKITIRFEKKTIPGSMESTFERVKLKYLEFAKETSTLAREGKNLSIMLRHK